jgi:hypothetical protein
MKRIVLALIVAVVLGVAGCGGSSSTELKTEPLTDEQKRQIKENDRKVDEEEGGTYNTRKRK